MYIYKLHKSFILSEEILYTQIGLFIKCYYQKVQLHILSRPQLLGKSNLLSNINSKRLLMQIQFILNFFQFIMCLSILNNYNKDHQFISTNHINYNMQEDRMIIRNEKLLFILFQSHIMKRVMSNKKDSKVQKTTHPRIPIAVLKNQSNQSQNECLNQRHFYQCFCACNYQSYSALYLHVKIKHNQNLSFKSLKKQTTEWSGSIKNIYFEFVENNQQPENNSMRSLRKLRQRVPKAAFQYSSSNNNQIDKKQAAVCEKQIQLNHQKVEKNVIQILKIYEHESIKQGKKVRKRILKELIQFINKNYEQISSQLATFQNYCIHNNCEQIPLLFNNFYESKYLNKPQNQQVIQVLINLSDWLYTNGYSKLLIVAQKQYDRFICKLKEKQNSAIIKNQAEHIQRQKVTKSLQ